MDATSLGKVIACATLRAHFARLREPNQWAAQDVEPMAHALLRYMLQRGVRIRQSN